MLRSFDMTAILPVPAAVQSGLRAPHESGKREEVAGRPTPPGFTPGRDRCRAGKRRGRQQRCAVGPAAGDGRQERPPAAATSRR